MTRGEKCCCLGRRPARWIAGVADCRHASYLSTEQTKGLTRGKRSKCKYELYIMREGALSQTAKAPPAYPRWKAASRCIALHATGLTPSCSVALESCLYFYMFKRLHLLFTPEPLDGGAASLVGAAGLLLPTNCFSRIWFIEQSFRSNMRQARVQELIVRLHLRGLSVYGRSDFGQLFLNSIK